MRQAEAIPVTVEDDEAQKLLERLAPGLYDRMIEIIESERDGIEVEGIVVRSIQSYEDPTWEELNFDVRSPASGQARSEYWDRLGGRLDDLLDQPLSPIEHEQLIKLVSIYVTPPNGI